MINNKEKVKNSQSQGAPIHSASVAVLKNQVNSVLPFRERRGLAHSKQAVAGGSKGSLLQVKNLAKAQPLLDFVGSPTSGRQVKPCQARLLNTLDAAGAMAPDSMSNAKASAPVKTGNPTSSIRNYQASCQQAKMCLQTEPDQPLQQHFPSQNQMRQLKSSAIQKSQKTAGKMPVLKLEKVDQNSESGEKLDFHQEARRSFSPRQMPSKASFHRDNHGCGRPSLMHSQAAPDSAIRLPKATGSRLLTEPIAEVKDNPGEQRRQLWQRVRSKDLGLAGQPPQSSSASHQLTLPKATVSFKNGVANSHATGGKPSVLHRRVADQPPQSLLTLSSQHTGSSVQRQPLPSAAAASQVASAGQATATPQQMAKKPKQLHKLLLAKPSQRQNSKHRAASKELLVGGPASDCTTQDVAGGYPSQTSSTAVLTTIQNRLSSPIQVPHQSGMGGAALTNLHNVDDGSNGFEPLIEVESMEQSSLACMQRREPQSPSEEQYQAQPDDQDQLMRLSLSPDIRRRLHAKHLGHVIEPESKYAALQSQPNSNQAATNGVGTALNALTTITNSNGGSSSHAKLQLQLNKKPAAFENTHNFVDSSVPISKLLQKSTSSQYRRLDSFKDLQNTKKKPLVTNNNFVNSASYQVLKSTISPRNIHYASQHQNQLQNHKQSIVSLKTSKAHQKHRNLKEKSGFEGLRTEVSPGVAHAGTTEKQNNCSQNNSATSPREFEFSSGNGGGSDVEQEQFNLLKSPQDTNATKKQLQKQLTQPQPFFKSPQASKRNPDRNTAKRRSLVSCPQEERTSITQRQHPHLVSPAPVATVEINDDHQDEFLVREQRVRDKLEMLQENDQQKVIQKLSQQQKNRQPRKLSHQFSTLMPVQNYTSTNDDLYKETIAARKIREAIGKMSNSLKHPPVSIVEKKKHQRIINQIEQDVAANKRQIDYAAQSSELQQQVALAGITHANQRNSMVHLLSSTSNDSSQQIIRNPPGGTNGSPQPAPPSISSTLKQPAHMQQSNTTSANGLNSNNRFALANKLSQQNIGGSEDENNFFVTETALIHHQSQASASSKSCFSSKNQQQQEVTLPVYSETTQLVVPSLNQITEESTVRHTATLSAGGMPPSETTAELNNRSQDTQEVIYPHKALNVLMRKAAKFDREYQPVIEQTKQSGESKEVLVRLAENFTHKEHFQKTFMRQSDAKLFQVSSPNKAENDNNEQLQPQNSTNLFQQQNSTNLDLQQQLQDFGYASDRSKNSFKRKAAATVCCPGEQQEESPPRQINVAEKEDRSFFMRIQRQYSQKQLMLTANLQRKNSKEPLLLYANKPQIIRKDSSNSPVQNDVAACGPTSSITLKSKGRISPNKIQLTSSFKQQQASQRQLNKHSTTATGKFYEDVVIQDAAGACKSAERDIVPIQTEYVPANSNQANAVQQGKKLKRTQVKYQPHHTMSSMLKQQKHQMPNVGTILAGSGDLKASDPSSTGNKLHFFLPSATTTTTSGWKSRNAASKGRNPTNFLFRSTPALSGNN